MPKYNYICPQCEGEKVRILKASEAPDNKEQCQVCFAMMSRAPRPATSQTMERLDNNLMPRAVVRLADAPRLFHEHCKGKKSAI